MNLHQPCTVEQLQCPRHGDVHGVVQVEAQHLALGFHHADHAVTLAADADAAAERIGRAEQFLLHLRTQHHEGARGTRVVRGQEHAGLHLHAESFGHFVADAVHRHAPRLAPRLDIGIALRAGIDMLDMGQAPQCLGILDAERAHRTDDAQRRPAPGARLARRNADQVGAELGEFGQDELVNTLADGGEQDHRGDAHRDAERGEEAAQPVRDDGAGSEGEEIADQHDSSSNKLSPQRTPRFAKESGTGSP
jgi:hypothetical protein